jgi:hypothetical protein
VKVQIQRLSPHQNGKVVAVLMVVVSLPLFLLMALLMWFGGPQLNQHGTAPAFPIFMFVVLPFFYLIFAYITVAIVCAIYNFFFSVIGGFEFDLTEQDDYRQGERRAQ